MREMAYLEIAERLKESGTINVANIQDLLEPTILIFILLPTFNVGCHLNATIISPSDAWGEQSREFWVKTKYHCDPVYALKCQTNGRGPNTQGGWKNFRNLINGGLGILETA